MNQSKGFFTNQNCPVCNGTTYTRLFTIDHRQSQVLEMLGAADKDMSAEVVHCNQCPHYYMTPIIADEHLNRYYSQVNSEFYLRHGGEVFNINAKEYAYYARLIQSKVPNGSILEIGCGNGFLLKTLQDKGFDCYGVEPSPIAYNHAKEKLGLKVENTFLHESSYYNEKFDVVIMIDVVEHISNIHLFMEQVTSIMKPGGYIFIGTGNINSLNAKLAGSNWGYFVSWEHVSFFNAKSMRVLLERFCFTEVDIQKTSLQQRPLQNITEFGKNFLKKLINTFLKRKFYHGICFDHMLVLAKYAG